MVVAALGGCAADIKVGLVRDGDGSIKPSRSRSSKPSARAELPKPAQPDIFGEQCSPHTSVISHLDGPILGDFDIPSP